MEEVGTQLAQPARQADLALDGEEAVRQCLGGDPLDVRQSALVKHALPQRVVVEEQMELPVGFEGRQATEQLDCIDADTGGCRADPTRIEDDPHNVPSPSGRPSTRR